MEPNEVDTEVIEEISVEEIFVNGELVAEEVKVREICVEGQTHAWDKETITSEEIAFLGGWAHSEGVLVIDADNIERTLGVDEVVVVEYDMVFAKKVRFRRG